MGDYLCSNYANPAVACCYDSSPPEYSTPIYDDPQQPDQIVDEAPADEVPDIVGTGSGQQIQTSGISAFGDGDSQTGEPIYPAGFVYHIRQLQAEGRQLEALMHIKDRLDNAPNDRVARTLLEKQMQKFDLAGPAGQIYLSEYQADDNRSRLQMNICHALPVPPLQIARLLFP